MIIINAFVIMVILIMVLLIVFNVRINVMLVHQPQIYAYLVMELTGSHGLQLIMIAFVNMVISTIIK